MQAQSTQEEGPGNGKQPGTGREASSCETIRTGAGGVEAEGREPEGAEAAEPGADGGSPAAAVSGRGRGARRSRPPSRPHRGGLALHTSPRRLGDCAAKDRALRSGEASSVVPGPPPPPQRLLPPLPPPASTPSFPKPPRADPIPPASDSHPVPPRIPPSLPPRVSHARTLLPERGADLAGRSGVTRGLRKLRPGVAGAPRLGVDAGHQGPPPEPRCPGRARGAGASSRLESVLTQWGPDVGKRLLPEKGPGLPQAPRMVRPPRQKPLRPRSGALRGVPPSPAASSARGDARRATFHF
ncbi:WAS/WASL-interacting protein family member 3-like [Oryx dammah]|uniref:WAS/WASL-interacting protein family member 3-like n=1 Tax=Oryx dammah TaxID=59534 RepID=UPI001A9AB75D|nr:WAS/WASL-interacting protein family member 3-like [Oryx dammah]